MDKLKIGVRIQAGSPPRGGDVQAVPPVWVWGDRFRKFVEGPHIRLRNFPIGLQFSRICTLRELWPILGSRAKNPQLYETTRNRGFAVGYRPSVDAGPDTEAEYLVYVEVLEVAHDGAPNMKRETTG